MARTSTLSIPSADKKADDLSIHSLTSTSSSFDSSTSSDKASLKVAFNPMITVYPLQESAKHRNLCWVTKANIEATKDDIRACAESVLEDSELRAAIDRLHDLIRAKSLSDADDASRQTLHVHTTNEKATGVCSGMCEFELARMLIDSELRGVERLLFLRLDESKGLARPAKRHSKVVLRAQASTRDMTPDERAEAIAQQCKTEVSSTWAYTLGQSDSKAITRDLQRWIIM